MTIKECLGSVIDYYANIYAIFHSLFKTKFTQVNLFRRSNKIDQLSDLSLSCRLEEKFEEIDIARVLLEVQLYQAVDGGADHKSIVDRNHADFWDAIPARLITTSDRRIHDIIGNEEVGLEL